MQVELDRMTIEDVGANPERLAQAIHDQLHGLEGAVPVYDIARALDIEEIRKEALTRLRGRAHHPPGEGFRSDRCECAVATPETALHGRTRARAFPEPLAQADP